VRAEGLDRAGLASGLGSKCSVRSKHAEAGFGDLGVLLLDAGHVKGALGIDRDEITAHLEIRSALTRYCPGVDRADAALIRSAFHPDATDSHGELSGTGWELADRLAAEHGKPGAGGHHITNVYIELDDADYARFESYGLAFHPHEDAGVGGQLGIFAGRYLDRFERRHGDWRIVERRVVNDWSREHLAGDSWARGSSEAGGFAQGARDESDPAYQLFPPTA
jgi:hypothetical protein